MGMACTSSLFLIFGLSLVISYAVFTLYHIFKYHARWGKLFKILDHATIYLLIAGTYTPFTLIFLRGRWGWTLFGLTWGIAVLGIIFKVFYIYRYKIMGPLVYLAMGWLLILAIKPAVELIPRNGLLLLLAGGLFYSFGLIFYAWKRLRFHHAIWHLFVLGGQFLSLCRGLFSCQFTDHGACGCKLSHMNTPFDDMKTPLFKELPH